MTKYYIDVLQCRQARPSLMPWLRAVFTSAMEMERRANRALASSSQFVVGGRTLPMVFAAANITMGKEQSAIMVKTLKESKTNKQKPKSAGRKRISAFTSHKEGSDSHSLSAKPGGRKLMKSMSFASKDMVDMDSSTGALTEPSVAPNTALTTPSNGEMTATQLAQLLSSPVSFVEFQQIMFEVLQDGAIGDIFHQYASDTLMSLVEWLKFQKDAQREPLSMTTGLENIFLSIAGNMFGLSHLQFQWVLLDPEFNSVVDRTKLDEDTDLSLPLSHYWISCSHNTFLDGGQLNSNSTPDMYRRVMLEGCRSVEIDCWDNQTDGDPDVTHGMTFCTKCKLKAVLAAIAQTAFDTSDLPVFISLEMHCSKTQQIKVANMIREIFGPALLLPEEVLSLVERGVTLSPETFRRRILIKGKTVNKSAQPRKDGSFSAAGDQGGGDGRMSIDGSTGGSPVYRVLRDRRASGTTMNSRLLASLRGNNSALAERQTAPAASGTPRGTPRGTIVSTTPRGTTAHDTAARQGALPAPAQSGSTPLLEGSMQGRHGSQRPPSRLPLRAPEKASFSSPEAALSPPPVPTERAPLDLLGGLFSLAQAPSALAPGESSAATCSSSSAEAAQPRVSQPRTSTDASEASGDSGEKGSLIGGFETPYDDDDADVNDYASVLGDDDDMSVLGDAEHPPMIADISGQPLPLRQGRPSGSKGTGRGPLAWLRFFGWGKRNETAASWPSADPSTRGKRFSFSVSNHGGRQSGYGPKRNSFDIMTGTRIGKKRKKKARYVDPQMELVTVVRSQPVDFLLAQGEVSWPLPISSVGEKDLLELLSDEATFASLQRATQTRLSRCYPRGTRYDSSNMMPLNAWRAGAQMVALNYQVNDLPVQLNRAFFERCGGSGYVPKPIGMLCNPPVWPPQRSKVRCTTIQFISLYQLPARRETRPLLDEPHCAWVPKLSDQVEAPHPGAISSPRLTVEVHTLGGYCCVTSKLPPPPAEEHTENRRGSSSGNPLSCVCTSASVTGNGLNPRFDFLVHCLAAEPKETILRISVQDGVANTSTSEIYVHDNTRDIAYEAVVLDGLREGYRSMALRSNHRGTRIDMCSLLVHVKLSDESLESDDSTMSA